MKKKEAYTADAAPIANMEYNQNICLDNEAQLKGLKVGDTVTVTLTGKLVELSNTYKPSLTIKDAKVKVEGSTVWSELSKEEDEYEDEA